VRRKVIVTVACNVGMRPMTVQVISGLVVIRLGTLSADEWAVEREAVFLILRSV
jgi:hypothetical protein